MITPCPSCRPSGSAITRPTMSVVPPGANGTIRRITLVGYACPNAGAAAMARAPEAAAIQRRRFMRLSLNFVDAKERILPSAPRRASAILARVNFLQLLLPDFSLILL